MDEAKFKALMSDNENLLDYVLQARFAMENVALGSLISISLVSIFTALKLEEIISWSWIWILAPGWLIIVIVMITTALLHQHNYKTTNDVLLERKVKLEIKMNQPQK